MFSYSAAGMRSKGSHSLSAKAWVFSTILGQIGARFGDSGQVPRVSMESMCCVGDVIYIGLLQQL